MPVPHYQFLVEMVAHVSPEAIASFVNAMPSIKVVTVVFLLIPVQAIHVLHPIQSHVKQ